MHERDWLKNEHCPGDATRVWIAVEPTSGGTAVTRLGFKNFDGKWHFDGAGRVSDSGMTVLAWYPAYPPAYIKN